METHLFPLDQEPKKIYVAASIRAQLDAARIALALQMEGFDVTSRWIRQDFSKLPTRSTDFRRWSLNNQEHAQMDAEDIDAADTLLLLADAPSSTGGFHFELGYFLGQGKTNVVMVGGQRDCCFHWLNPIRWASDDREALSFFKLEHAGFRKQAAEEIMSWD